MATGPQPVPGGNYENSVNEETAYFIQFWLSGNDITI
jgi:hypothetical protein